MSYRKVGSLSAIAMQQSLLKRHDDHEITLSEWEYRFLDNIWIKAMRNELTKKQRNTLGNIYRKYDIIR